MLDEVLKGAVADGLARTSWICIRKMAGSAKITVVLCSVRPRGQYLTDGRVSKLAEVSVVDLKCDWQLVLQELLQVVQAEGLVQKAVQFEAVGLLGQ